MESFLARLFEILSVSLFVLFLIIIKKKYAGNRHYYACLLACLFSFLWEWYMDVGPLQLGYHKAFLSLWVIDGVSLPLCMPFSYGWYWFLPNLVFLPLMGWMDRHWGKMQFLYIFIIVGLYNVLVEYPATTWTSNLWNYYWQPDTVWSLGGIPITNAPAAGLSSLLIFVFARYLIKQDEDHTKDTFGVLFLKHAAAVNLAFYVTWIIFTPILGLTMPYWHVKFL
jgi:hypothetical protein